MGVLPWLTLCPHSLLHASVYVPHIYIVLVLQVGYAAVHFPWGRGEYEDERTITDGPGQWRCGVRAPQAANAPPVPCSSNHRACLPVGPCVSELSAARVALSHAYTAHGARLLPLWDLSVDAYEGHLNHGVGTSRAEKFTLDCRHWCNPGSVTLGFARRLFALLP